MRQFIKKTDNTVIDLGVQPITNEVLENVIVQQCTAEDIQEIHIENAAFGDEGAIFLANVVRGNKKLEALHINAQHNYFSQTDDRITGQGMKVLALALRINKNVHTLSLSQHNIGDFGATQVGYMLKNCGIKHLNLDYNDIRSNGFANIAESLGTNRTLESLSLVDNVAKDEGAKALAYAMKANNTIKDLNLTGNTIGWEGAGYVATSIKNHPSVTTLVMKNNSMGIFGMKSFADALLTNTILTSIDLSDNHIGLQRSDDEIEGACALMAAAIGVNQKLTHLNLANNKLNMSGQALIDNAKRANPRLAASVSTATSAVARVSSHSTGSSSAAGSAASRVKKLDPLRI